VHSIAPTAGRFRANFDVGGELALAILQREVILSNFSLCSEIAIFDALDQSSPWWRDQVRGRTSFDRGDANGR
jgi:hypothetical protein